MEIEKRYGEKEAEQQLGIQEKSREAEKQRSREADKQKSRKAARQQGGKAANQHSNDERWKVTVCMVR